MSVTLEHVTRTVDGIPTIRDVSLTLERGTLSVLLGPTLSGKTSIMRLLAGLDRPTTGRVLVDGKDVTGMDEVISAVNDHDPGDELTLTVLSDGNEHDVTVKLGDRPGRIQDSQAPSTP